MIVIKKEIDGKKKLEETTQLQISEEMSGPDLHISTLKFLTFKTTWFSPIKKLPKICFDFRSMQLFSADPKKFLN